MIYDWGELPGGVGRVEKREVVRDAAHQHDRVGEAQPHVWVVDPIPRSALTDPELDRVHELERQDPDDVPAALLALATRAVLLSEDEALLEAVYGEPG